MKRIAVLVTLLVFLASTSVVHLAFGQSAIRVYVDGQPTNFDVPPTVIQGRVLVPLRGVFERLGATVDYDTRTQHIVAVHDTQTVELTIGSRQARVNNQPSLLDVPAFTMGGRTMVPLRFVSESLGASVQWVDASRIILIGSTGGSPPPPLQGTQGSTPPPAQGQTITGSLMAVTTGQNPRIVVRGGGQDTTFAVIPDTAIFRYNAQTNAGGSAPLGALRKGDQVTVLVNDQNQATKITANYRVVSGGKIARVNPQNRMITLTNGQTFVVQSDAEITLNGQPADWGALQVGRNARFQVVEGTNQAYVVRVASSTAQTPSATNATVPHITSPAGGATVGSSFSVQGTAQPGALVMVNAQPRLLGQATQGQTTADASGNWAVSLNVSAIPFVTFPYVVSAVGIMNGVQSDPTSIELSVR